MAQNDTSENGGCPTCGASPEHIEEQPATDGLYVCRACGCQLLGDNITVNSGKDELMNLIRERRTLGMNWRDYIRHLLDDTGGRSEEKERQISEALRFAETAVDDEGDRR